MKGAWNKPAGFPAPKQGAKRDGFKLKQGMWKSDMRRTFQSTRGSQACEQIIQECYKSPA